MKRRARLRPHLELGERIRPGGSLYLRREADAPPFRGERAHQLTDGRENGGDGLMYWHGIGVTRDRKVARIWLDYAEKFDIKK